MYDMKATRTWLRNLYGRGFSFPNTYFVFDFETTGLDMTNDVIIQAGYMIVEDGKIIQPARAELLNWPSFAKFDQEWLKQRLVKRSEVMRNRGVARDFTYEDLKTGAHPVDYLLRLLAAFELWQSKGAYFIAHNGYRYDAPLISIHFRDFLRRDFGINCNNLIDTGLFEKAMQQPRLYLPNTANNLCKFYYDIEQIRSRVSWGLSNHCVTKYKLADNYDINMRNAHTADFDCYITHLLYQEYRKIALES